MGFFTRRACTPTISQKDLPLLFIGVLAMIQQVVVSTASGGHRYMSGLARTILLIVLILLLIGLLPAWPYSAGFGYYPSGGLGLVLVIVLILLVLGKI
jgi:hypothetical protein